MGVQHSLKRNETATMFFLKKPLVVIMLPGAKNFTRKYCTIDNLLNYSTCLEWTENEETQAVFWLRQEIETLIPKPEHDLHAFFILA